MLRSGSTLQDRYQVLEELGRGGMAAVYKSYQPALERYVALKVLPWELTHDREFVQRFLREARSAAKLNHPNIVTIHDVGQTDETYFIVMEYVDGPSLADILQRQAALSPQRVVQIISQVASALDYAHQRGFVHRDIKPANILVGAGQAAKLTDFGIVKAAEGTRLTQTGTLLGTPAYMSPEQARGTNITHVTDIYSLGVVVYEMLSGRVPFSGETMAVLHAHAYDRPDLSVLPRGVQRVVGKALEKDPRKRFKSAGAFARDLSNALAGVSAPQPRTDASAPSHSGRPQPSSRRIQHWAWPLGAAAFAVIVGGLVALAAGGRGTAPQTPQATPSIRAIETASSPPAHTPAPGTIIYTVREGDTLDTIAAAFNTTVGQIVAANGLDSEILHVRQELTIPLFAEVLPTSGPTIATDAVTEGDAIPTHTPSPPTATSAPTSTPPPTDTPSPTPRPQLLVEGAEGYADATSLNTAYQINHCWDANEAQLSLAAPPHVGEGSRAIAFWFNIRQAPPNDYAGFERFLATPQDWSGRSHLCLWIENDGSINELVVQFREKDGEVWKHHLGLSPGARDSCIPLSAGPFVHADWSPAGNDRVDLRAIDYYGVYVHRSQPGSGTVYVDNIRMVSQ